MPAPVFLSGTEIYLRSLVESDAEGPYLSWFNDSEVCQGNSHHSFPFTQEEAIAYIQNARRSRDSLVLAIVWRDGGRHVGNAALQQINWISRSAEFAIVIGDKELWGKGIARQAMHLLFNHGFATLNLNRIYCATFEHNSAMRRAALALGMKEEGRRREAAFKNGQSVDVIEFGLLRSEAAQGIGGGATVP